MSAPARLAAPVISAVYSSPSSVVVSRRTCAKISAQLGLDAFLVLGKGMGTQDQTPPSVLADVFESLIGAIYLDGGMEAAKRFIVSQVEAEIDATVEGQGGSNYKSHLQQVAQRRFGETPIYLLLDERVRTIRSVSRSRRKSAGGAIPPPGARTRRTPSNSRR